MTATSMNVQAVSGIESMHLDAILENACGRYIEFTWIGDHGEHRFCLIDALEPAVGRMLNTEAPDA